MRGRVHHDYKAYHHARAETAFVVSTVVVAAGLYSLLRTDIDSGVALVGAGVAGAALSVRALVRLESA